MERHKRDEEGLRIQRKGVGDFMAAILGALGFDLKDPSLKGTPDRVARAYQEMLAGYDQDPEEILSTQFEVGHDEMVIVHGIPFVSLCEHHILPFEGTVAIGYIPGGEQEFDPESGKTGIEKSKVVGLSKLARLVKCFSRRLQVQERMTDEIAQAIQDHLGAIGVGVVVRGSHSCMRIRGVQTPGEMVTSSMLGVLRSNPATRAEFLQLIQ